MPKKELTLATLDGGALEEMVARELAWITENIRDTNTKRNAKRKLDISVVFSPDDKGETTSITYGVKSKLAPMLAGTTSAYVAITGEETVGLVEYEKHPALPFGEEEGAAPAPAATPLRRMAAQG